jgi:L-seryl-tRNA(Ser) seleniumtransferase
MPDNRRRLPSVERVLAVMRDGTAEGSGHQARVAAIRKTLSAFRAGAANDGAAAGVEEVAARATALLANDAARSLRRVINATGVILQTNLGRAPLSERAIAAMNDAARGYTNLEFDLDSGGRGSRHEHVRALIRDTTGAEDGLVVNNNAAALLMVLQVLAPGREVMVSRGQAVEIGGGFRIPDVLQQSGAQLVEVGTTNRTYARDYEAAWRDMTAAILRVHTSNFKIVGFTASPTGRELANVAHERGGLLFDDLGSGCLIDTAPFGLAHEPTVQESIADGADLVLFSGDKLLGGPQCGVIAGRADLISPLRAHPLARALRVDKITIAALSATLQTYVDGRHFDEIPVWKMLSLDAVSIRRRAQRWARAAGAGAAVVADRSMVGGGSLPTEGVPTWCASVPRRDGATAYATSLRSGPLPIIARISGGAVLLDPRTVSPSDDSAVAARLTALS